MTRVPVAILALVLALPLAACAARPAVPTTPVAAAPTSLDQALTARGLVRIELATVRRDTTWDLSAEQRVEGSRITRLETAGWSSSRTIFARRADGAIVIVHPRPQTIVDRHVWGGCRGFAGGRGWFEEVEYELPPGATFGGTVTVRWDEHVEVVDYADSAPDGSPCPPPAID